MQPRIDAFVRKECIDLYSGCNTGIMNNSFKV